MLQLPYDHPLEMRRLSIIHSITGLSLNNLDRIIELLKSIRSIGKSPIGNYELGTKYIDALIRAYEDEHVFFDWIRLNYKRVNYVSSARFIENILVRNFLYSQRKREQEKKVSNNASPHWLGLSWTMKCNLNCKGCFTRNYKYEEELSSSEVKGLLKEARDIGISVICVAGGEPFIHKGALDFITSFPELEFLVFTNGYFLNSRKLDQLQKSGNAIIMLSLEGDERATDSRRGTGSFNKAVNLFKDLKQRGLIYGFSANLNSSNIEEITSERFVDSMIDKGCTFGWYTVCTPIGTFSQTDFMPTGTERYLLQKKVREYRKTKPIVIVDMWNDAGYIKGCAAAGQHYFHVNSRGDVEPCNFIPFSTDNIKNKSLRQCLESDFFRSIRKSQPLCKDYRLSCLATDHTKRLKKIVEDNNATPTYPNADSMLHGETFEFLATNKNIYIEMLENENE